MRFYDIQITDPTSGQMLRRYTSQLNNGSNDPNALRVELDITATAYAQPIGVPFIRVWGVSLQELGSAANLNGKAIAVYGGMAKGLPLANPAQQGLLAAGQVQQCFGNWIGTAMTLDMLMVVGQPVSATPGQPNPQPNITVNWEAGQPLAHAIAQTLTVAFPGYTADIHISDNLILNHNAQGFYRSVVEFAQWVKQQSMSIVTADGYAGVEVVLRNRAFSVYDGTTAKNPTQIAFQDLIGQPTWIEANHIQLTTVMRGDIGVGDYVKLPPTLIQTTAAALSQYRDNSIFQGAWVVGGEYGVRHVGNSRNPAGDQWVSVFDLYPALSDAAAPAASTSGSAPAATSGVTILSNLAGKPFP